MYWNWINVFDHESFVGSFHTATTNKADIKSEIDQKYGHGKWTRYTIE